MTEDAMLENEYAEKTVKSIKDFQKYLMEEYDLRPSTALAIVYYAVAIADLVKAEIYKERNSLEE